MVLYPINHQQFREESYKRLIRIFRSKWFRQNEHHDVFAAKYIVDKLEKFGSPVDYAIFDTYLKIIENSSGPFDLRNGGFYYDDMEAYRPKSNHFQHIHWDWTIFANYLFDNTRSVMLPRKWDLAYLTFVKETAIKMGSDKPLKTVLEQADHEWAQAVLQKDTHVLDQYAEFKMGRSHKQIYKSFLQRVTTWISEARTKELRTQRSSAAHDMLASFRNSTSVFDLMLMEKYFDLVVRYKVENRIGDTYNMVPKWIHLNDTMALELGLAYGSLHYMTDFIFQNSHNLKVKKHLMDVLNLLDSFPLKSRYKVGDFFSSYNKAYFDIIESAPKAAPPVRFNKDLHIYSRSLNPNEATVDSLEHTIVHWDEVVGHLQVKTVETYPVDRNKHATVRAHPQLKAYVEEYFELLRSQKIYSETETNRDEQAELNALLLDSTFFVFTPSERSKLISMARLFDGTNSKTYIEAEFPHVKFPERETGGNIFEIGRLLSRIEASGENLEIILSRVAEHLYTKKVSGTIYFDVNRAVRALYLRKYKVEEVYTPEQLNIAPGATPVWIMKMSVEKFIESFLNPELVNPNF